VADTGNQTIRKITTGAAVTTLAGFAGNYGSADGTGTNAQFYGPAGLAADGLGSIYVADYFNQTIRKVTAAGVVSTLAGLTGSFGSADGTNSAARFWNPAGVAVSGTNNVTVYVADAGNGTIRTLTPSGAANWVSSTLAGSASTGNADATTGSAARFYWPAGAAVDSAGNAYVADTQNGTIRKVTTAAAVSTLAGSAGNCGSADGTGTNARFYGPEGIALDSAGMLYVADTVNATIRKITPGGTVSTLAGTAGSYGVADGTGSAAQFYEPQGLALDSGGNVYVADTWNHTIRRITPGGVVSTLAGFPGNSGCTDGTGSNVGTNTARFNGPAAIAVDQATNVYVADYFNHTIRKITPAGLVSTLAGLAGVWGSADGTNDAARFYLPAGIALDSATNIYVLDSGNHTIRKVAPVGTNWVVSTIAGVADVSGSSDGLGTNAQFDYPAGLAVDSTGSLYVADTGNNTLRQGAWITTGPPNITSQPQDQTVNQGASATFTVTAIGSPPL
jgi:sugar lactone lactonase YvrE